MHSLGIRSPSDILGRAINIALAALPGWSGDAEALARLPVPAERFRRRHQGPLMERAGELFRRLTLDAFAGLDSGYDDRDEPILLAVRHGGDKLEVASLNSTTARRLVSGRARKFWEIWQKNLCSILFHFEVPGGSWQTAMVRPVSSANFWSSIFHNRTLAPLEPPPSAVIINRSAAG